MRKLLIVVIAAALVWSGYWFVGAHFVKKGIAGALEDLRQTGWELNDPTYRLRGFPNRFDTTFESVDFVTPDGTALQAAFFQILALSYKPNQIITVLPPRIELQSVAGDATITNERARGSVTVQTARSLPLDRSSFVIDDLRVDSEGESLVLEQLRVATRLPDGAPDARHQNIGIEVLNLALPAPLQAQLGAMDLGEIDALRLDATLDFDAPLDRSAFERMPLVDQIDIHDVSVDWGGIAIGGGGTLNVGTDGRLDGTVDLVVERWREVIDIAVSLGLFAERDGQRIARVLEFMSDGDDLALPVSFANGFTMLGALPIGPAPNLR